jgi:hypothetical protein
VVTALVHLGFGKYARADRIYALAPIEGEARGPGRRTRVWIEGIAEPVVASRSEAAILADMGPDRSVVPGDLAAEALTLLARIAEQVGGVGPLLRREIRAEASLDLDELEARVRALLQRTASPSDPEALF